jgi:DNA-binding GntR family transcriptional regulator
MMMMTSSSNSGNGASFQLLGNKAEKTLLAGKTAQTASNPVVKGGRLLEGFTPETTGVVTGKPNQQAFDFISSTEGTSTEKSSKATSFSAGFERLNVKQLPRKKPEFTAGAGSKDMLIAAWLTQWITTGLSKGILTENHLLPLKQEIAGYLGVSIGTVQNAIRYVEDDGLVESKQRIGTLIRGSSANTTTGETTMDESRVRKQTSKRDTAVVALQQYFVKANFEVGQALPASRELAKVIGSAPNTTRLALEFLTVQGLLSSNNARGKKANWILQAIPNLEANQLGSQMVVQTDTLIDQLERDLKQLISDDYEVNMKLPSHLELAESLKVSIKTVHDAMQRLVIQGYVHSKRGRYGTFVSRIPSNLINVSAIEQLFVPAEEHAEPEAAFYHYQQAEEQLRALLKTQYSVGQQLQPMPELATQLGVSMNSVRRALQTLAEEGLVSFKRGRFGGTIVENIPQ